MSKKSRTIPLILIWVMLLTFILLPTPAHAATNSVQIVSHSQAMQTYQQKRLETVRQKALSDIAARLTSLNKLSLQVANLTWISDSQKSLFSIDITASINDLTQLQNKIVADSTLESLQTDQKSISATYTLFAVFEPRASILSQADAKLGRISILSQQLSSSASVTKIAEAKNLAFAAVDDVSSLVPSSYPGNLTSLKTARIDLNKSEADIIAAQNI